MATRRIFESTAKRRTVFGFAILALFVMGGVLRYRVGEDLESKLHAITQAGYPLTREDLGRLLPAVAEEKNAARHIMNAMEDYVGPSGDDEAAAFIERGAIDDESPPIPEAFLETVAEYLESNGDVLEALSRTPEFSAERYSDLGLNSAEYAGRMATIESAVRLLVVKAAYAEMNDDLEAAAEALDAAYSICVTLRNGYGRSAFDRPGVERLVNLSVERIIRRGTPVMDYGRLVEWTELLDTSDTLARGYIGERVRLIEFFRDLDAEELTANVLGGDVADALGRVPLGISISAALIRFSGLGDLNFIKFLDAYELIVDTADGPLVEALDLSRYAVDPDDYTGFTGAYARGTLPDVETAIQAEAIRLGVLRRIRAAIALEIFRLIYFGPPDTLEGIVPEFLNEFPSDPTTGLPLFYAREGAGYAIWAVSDRPNLYEPQYRERYGYSPALRVAGE